MAVMEAIVLNSIQYKDSSKILNLYTENGHKSVIAHGVKKLNSKNRFLSQNCTIISLNISDKKLPSLGEGELVNEFPNIKKDIYKYSYMSHILELVKNTISDESDHLKMYSFLKRLLQLVDNGFSADTASFIFELKLLHFLGYGLNFRMCNVCGKTENLEFHISSGGLTCREHLDENIHTYGSDVYLVLKALYYLDINKPITLEIDKTSKIIVRHIIDVLFDEFISFNTKSMKIIKQIEKY